MTPRQKDFIREITGHKLRFASLLALIAIGVFVLVGLTVTGPIMRRTIQKTLDEGNHYDLKLDVAEGLQDEDLERLNALEGVAEKEYFHTAFLTSEKRETVYISSLPKRISLPNITEGRAPKAVDEILLDHSLKGKYSIGDMIEFEREEDPFDKDAKPVFNRYSYRVTGFARSILFLDEEEKGSTARGDKIDGFGYVLPLAFRDPTITQAQFQFKDLEGLAVYSDEYARLNKRHREGFKAIFSDRPEKRLDERIADIRGDIRDGEEEIDEGYNKLDDAWNAILDGEEEWAEGRDEFLKGKADFRTGMAQGEATLSDSKRKLDRARNSILFQEDRLSAGEKALLDGKNAIAAGIVDGMAGKEEALAGIQTADETLEKILREEKAIREARERLERGETPALKSLPELPYSEKTISDAKAELSAIDSRKNAIRKKSIAAQKELMDKDSRYDEALAALKQTGVDEQTISSKIKALDEKIAGLEEGEDSSDLERQKAELENSLKSPSYLKAKSEADRLKKIRDEASVAFEKQNNALLTDNKRKRELNAMIAAQNRAKDAREKALDGLEREQKDVAASEEEKLARVKAELAAREKEVAEQKARALAGKAQSEAALQKLDASKRDLALAESELKDKKREIAAGSAEIAAAKAKLREGESELQKGKVTLDAKRREGERKLDRAEAELYEGRADLDEARAEYAAEKPDALKDLKEGEEDIEKARDILSIIEKPIYEITPMNEESITYTFLDYSDRMDQLSMVFPVFLFAIALLLASTVMNRMVDEERILIGTYKALGYSDGAIAWKYVLFGTLAALLGGIPGGILGNFLLSSVVAEAYLSGASISGLAMSWYPMHIVFSVVLGMLATGFIAWISARKSLRHKTAILLLPKPPAKGTRIVLERIAPLWKRLSFFQKVTARNLFRDKKRMVMTIVGVMGCVALLLLGFGIRTSVDGLVNKQFKEIERYDFIVRYEPAIDRKGHQDYLKHLEDDEEIRTAVSGHMESLRVDYDKGLDQNLIMVVPEDTASLKKVVNLRERKSGKTIDLTKGAVITEKLAEIKDLKPGDVLVVKDDDEREYEIPIASIAEGYAGHYLYMDKKDYEEIFNKAYEDNMHYLATGGKDVSRYKDYDSVVALIDTNTMTDRVDDVASNINFIVMVILAASSTLAVVVLSTLTTINIEERRREISTIRVLGFYPKEVTRYIYRETATLTAVGIILGFFVGKGLHRLVIRVVVPDFAMLDPALGLMNYLLPAVITLVISTVLMFWFHGKLQKIDMVEALKSVE
nr:FtsX-like permease family protein [uncultured Peptoniphilus sp.]